jgi:hypothetical protein
VNQRLLFREEVDDEFGMVVSGMVVVGMVVAGMTVWRGVVGAALGTYVKTTISRSS